MNELRSSTVALLTEANSSLGGSDAAHFFGGHDRIR